MVLLSQHKIIEIGRLLYFLQHTLPLLIEQQKQPKAHTEMKRKQSTLNSLNTSIFWGVAAAMRFRGGARPVFSLVCLIL